MNEKQEILRRTDGGLDVFVHYLTEKCLERVFSNPYREDSHPSCHLYCNKMSDGTQQYYLKDFGDSSFSGNCFAFVGKIAHVNPNTDFVQILKIIDKELNLGVFDRSAVEYRIAAKVKADAKYKKPVSVISFEYSCKKPTEKDIQFWAKYGIDERTLKKYNVKFLHHVNFHREDKSEYSVFASNAFLLFGYVFGNGKGIKIYRPTAKTRFMYGGEFPKPYIFGMEQLPPKGEMVIITGGEKDVLSLAAHGFNAISFNSETANISEEVMRELAGRFKKILFLYDMDETGKKESAMKVKQFKDKYNVGRIELPLEGTKKEKDISDYFEKGKTKEELNRIIKLMIWKW